MWKRKTQCQRVQGLLSSYLDDRLSSSERNAAKQHLRTCVACRREVDSLEGTLDLLHRIPPAPVLRSFALTGAEHSKRSISSVPAFPGMNWLRVATAAAATLLAVVVVGDASGILVGQPSPNTEIPSEIAIPAMPTEVDSPTVLPMNAAESRSTARLPQPMPQDETVAAVTTVPEHEQALPPQPSPAPPADVGIASRAGSNAPESGNVSPTSASQPGASTDEPSLSHRAELVPNAQEATPASPPSATSRSGAMASLFRSLQSWVRTVEIGLAALVAALLGFSIARRRPARRRLGLIQP